MNKRTFELLGYNTIINKLADYAVTMQAKQQIEALTPFLSEKDLRYHLRNTTMAKSLMEEKGTPPLPAMEHMEEYLIKIDRCELLEASQIEEVGGFLKAVSRLKRYLKQGEDTFNSLAFYNENLEPCEELITDIEHAIRDGRIDDFATSKLFDIRKKMGLLDEKIREKAEAVLRTNKEILSEGFVVNRNGHICIPVKKQYRSKVAGNVIETSNKGATVFIEPASIDKLTSQKNELLLDEDEEVRRILYTLIDRIAVYHEEITENMRIIIMLDFAFAKGKMSSDMKAVEPEIRTDRYICLEKARHPQLIEEQCVPLDFEMKKGTRGVVITGPNTGGKTVAIKTVALLSLMACTGLHVPASRAQISMNAQVLCDIGDGQSVNDNLSTFSAHIKNIVDILKHVNKESLVVLDELGSGTDPAEGMGIAIAILEQLRKSGANFLVTTHYPEVKHFADQYAEIENACMAFDRESLKPLYRLEIGTAGESCAFFIARSLGIPDEMLRVAASAAYKEDAKKIIEEMHLSKEKDSLEKVFVPKIEKMQEGKKKIIHGQEFTRGDSVLVLPEGKIGIVVKPADKEGNVYVQIQNEKCYVNHKRVKLLVAADKLYPEDYDFSIVFESVEVRKARHDMNRKYVENELHLDE